MRIEYLLTTGDGRAGTEKAIADQTNAMAARGHDVTMISVYRSGGDAFDFGSSTRIEFLTDLAGPDGIPSMVIPAEWDSQFCPTADRALMARLAASRADIIVTSTPALLTYALLAAPPDAKVVAEEHRGTMRRGISAEPLLRHGPSADCVVSLTERNAQWLEASWGDQSPCVRVIPNAIPATGRPRSGGSQNVVMSAGRLVRGKGFADLVRAFSLVAYEFPQWRLRIFGDGPEHDRIITTVRNLGLSDRVELLASSSELDREWARASIGALTSTSEGLPLILLEARAAGLPLVAYDCETGPREIIRHGEDGFLVSVSDTHAFADALRLLMADPSLRDRMSSRAEESLERFAPGRVAEQWNDLFEELVRTPGTRRAGVTRGARILAADAPAASTEIAGGAAAVVPEAPDPAAVISEDYVRAQKVSRHEIGELESRERTRGRLESLFAGSSVRSRPLRHGQDGLGWAVAEDAREDVLRILADADIPGLDVRLYAGRLRLDSDGRSWRTGEESIDPDDVTRVYAYIHYAVAGTTQHRGYSAGLTVDFWAESDARPGVWGSPQGNLEVSLLLPSQFDKPLFSPWTPMRGRPLWSAINFPVDAVYTWVDGADPDWLERRAPARGTGPATHALASGDLRFLNRDELRYSLRSLRQNAPWIRSIYLVTDAQRPHWLKDGEGVTVVDHRDLFPDTSVLPVFNSQAIETVLHRIPGLSDHFVMLNDDVFFMRPQSPGAYFTSAGQAKFFPSPTKINDLGVLAEPHEQAGMNNRALLEDRFGVTITQGMLHSPHPHRRDVLERLEGEYTEAITRTRASKFRSDQDISPLSSFAQYAGSFEGEYVAGSLRCLFVPLGGPETSTRLTRARGAQVDCMAFGEAMNDPDPDLTQEMALNFMASKFPVPAPWEHAGC